MTPADIDSVHSAGHLCVSYGTQKLPAPLQPMLHSTPSEYMKSLSVERQRLLAHCIPAPQHIWATVKTFYQLTILSYSPQNAIETATDGGLKNRLGTFGWVMTGANTHFLSGAGPVDGDPETSSSTRSEWFGYAALLEGLLMIATLHPPHLVRGPIPVHTWIDNKAVADHIIEFLDPTFIPSRAYPHDADIISHIQWLWKQLPLFTFSAGWVQSHQDKQGQIQLSKLQNNAQLNVLADGLATEYYNHGLHRPLHQPHFYPSTKVSLVVNKQRATAQYYDIIRFHINGTKHKLFLQSSRPGWNTERVWSSIDMEGLGIAFKTLSKPLQHKHCKMMHGWWNTGHQRATITPDSNSCCPIYSDPDETTEHILRCNAPSAGKIRYLALPTLKAAGKRIGLTSVTWDILFRGI